MNHLNQSPSIGNYYYYILLLLLSFKIDAIAARLPHFSFDSDLKRYINLFIQLNMDVEYSIIPKQNHFWFSSRVPKKSRALPLQRLFTIQNKKKVLRNAIAMECIKSKQNIVRGNRDNFMPRMETSGSIITENLIAHEKKIIIH